MRRKTKEIKVRDVVIGGSAPISVQSMTKTDTRDIDATISQIRRLEDVGCEIVRVSVKDSEAANALPEIKRRIGIPLVADVHFDYRLAIASIEKGVDKIRINPGNIRDEAKIREIVLKAKERGIPIRIGVNSGSINEKATPSEMVNLALKYVGILEKLRFYDIIISLKASDVPTTLASYQLMAGHVDYPFHIGITESGLPLKGGIKSAVGIGILLFQGIGDTIRVSLTGDPVEEVKAGYEILKALSLRTYGYEIISCPTCGRCEIDLVRITEEVEDRLSNFQLPTSHFPLKIAIMGCVVNGPGEARHADIGIAGGKGVGILFKRGKVVKRIKEKDLVETLLYEVRNWR
ncbi:MAG: flavodoxin-dependent (E)-4-hydroxy-3-methylbut-2-enyl-diphosphate synthase [bacterium]|nr:flavodoxin-dependent (E)-4-hydroxy-3-methylbut-2-enyl-diphosphate synthase [bacterium]